MLNNYRSYFDFLKKCPVCSHINDITILINSIGRCVNILDFRYNKYEYNIAFSFTLYDSSICRLGKFNCSIKDGYDLKIYDKCGHLLDTKFKLIYPSIGFYVTCKCKNYRCDTTWTYFDEIINKKFCEINIYRFKYKNYIAVSFPKKNHIRFCINYDFPLMDIVKYYDKEVNLLDYKFITSEFDSIIKTLILK